MINSSFKTGIPSECKTRIPACSLQGRRHSPSRQVMFRLDLLPERKSSLHGSTVLASDFGAGSRAPQKHVEPSEPSRATVCDRRRQKPGLAAGWAGNPCGLLPLRTGIPVLLCLREHTRQPGRLGEDEATGLGPGLLY